MFYGCDNESFVSEENPGGRDGVPLNLDSLHYDAASPDEKAILEGCSYLGMKFAGKKAEGELRERERDIDQFVLRRGRGETEV